jgi:hypothetical protein
LRHVPHCQLCDDKNRGGAGRVGVRTETYANLNPIVLET